MKIIIFRDYDASTIRKNAQNRPTLCTLRDSKIRLISPVTREVHCTCRELTVLEDAHSLHLMEYRIVRCIYLVTAVHITSADKCRFASGNKCGLMG